MKVEIQAFLEIKELIKGYPGDAGMAVNLSSKANVHDLLEQLSLPEQKAVLVLINGTYARYDAILHDGDVVKIMPFLEGG